MGVLVVEESFLARSALGGPVMQGPPQYLWAEGLPVVARMEQMQMPHHIHLVGGRYGVVGGAGQKAKATVFFRRFSCLLQGPALLYTQPPHQVHGPVGVLEGVVPQSLLEGLLEGVADIAFYHGHSLARVCFKIMTKNQVFARKEKAQANLGFWNRVPG